MSQAFEDFKVYDTNIKAFTGQTESDSFNKNCTKLVFFFENFQRPRIFIDTEKSATIYWGDGTVSKNTKPNGRNSHEYTTIDTDAPATVVVRIYNGGNILNQFDSNQLKKGLIEFVSDDKDFIKIPDYFLQDCANLKKLVLPPNLDTIGRNAFQNTLSLGFVKIPSKVKKLGYQTFQGSGVREVVIVQEQKTKFYVDSNCFKNSNLHSLQCIAPSNTDTSPVNNEITLSGSGVFSNCENLTTIPKIRFGSLSSVDAFSRTINLKTLNLLEMGQYVKLGYSCFERIIFPKDPKMIVIGREYAFENNLNLREVVCMSETPYSVQGVAMFYRCPVLSRILVPNGSGEKYRTATGWNQYKDLIVEVSQTTGMTQATDTKLGGVKAVAKTTEMTEPVGIDTDGKLYSKSGGGGGQGSSIYDCAEPITKETLKVLATTVYLPPNFTLKVGDMLFGENGGRALIKSISEDGTELTLQFLGELPPNVEIIHFDEPVSATSGTITQEEYDLLSYNTQNLIEFNRELYRLNDDRHEEGFKVYTHVGHDATNKFFIKCITITISTKGWVLSSTEVGGGGGAIPQATETKLGGVKARTYSGYEKSYEVFIGSSGFLSAFGLPIKLFDIKYESGSSSHGSGRIGVVFFGYNKVDSVFPIKSGVFNFSNYTWESGGDGGTTIGKVLMFHTKETVTFPDPYGHEVRLYNLTDHTYEVLPSGAYQRELPANKSYILLSNMDYGET